jgi:FkbM family methyltransferase
MNIEKFGEHSLDLNLVDQDGWILDVGCRRFDFAGRAAEFGCRVLALDPGTVDDPQIDRVQFLNVALVADPKMRKGHLYEFGKGAGSHMGHIGKRTKAGTKKKTVPCIDLVSLMREFGIEKFEAVKLDCEGSEYEILLRWPGPVAKQISVEFHDFHELKRPKPLDQMPGYYRAMFQHIGQWYDVVQHKPTTTLTVSTPNYWDSLFVLRETAENSAAT